MDVKTVRFKGIVCKILSHSCKDLDFDGPDWCIFCHPPNLKISWFVLLIPCYHGNMVAHIHSQSILLLIYYIGLL